MRSLLRRLMITEIRYANEMNTTALYGCDVSHLVDLVATVLLRENELVGVTEELEKRTFKLPLM